MNAATYWNFHMKNHIAETMKIKRNNENKRNNYKITLKLSKIPSHLILNSIWNLIPFAIKERRFLKCSINTKDKIKK